MNTFEAIAARVSVRDFSDAPVEREKIEQIVQAALFAPVGMKRYDSLHLSVLSTHAAVAKFTALAREQCGDPAASPVHNAGALIIVSGKRPDEHTEYANAGCMVENMLLAATELGLGSLYVQGAVRAMRGTAQEAKLRALLNLPEGFTPVGSAAVGYCSEQLSPRTAPKNDVTKVDYIG